VELIGHPALTTNPAGLPTGVVWDLGNVLIDWDASRAIAAGVGPQQARRFLDEFDFLAYNHGPDSGSTWDDAEAALASSHPHWLPHARAYRRHFAASLVGEVPGSGDLVRTLHAAGVRQWGLTNWSHELYPHAPEMFPLLGLLDGVVVSGTEGVAKPDPAIYTLVAERSGLAPEQLVFLDDRAVNVDAARDAGMTGLVFTTADVARRDLHALGLPV